MKVFLVVIAAIGSCAAGVLLAGYLWLAAAQNSSMSRSSGEGSSQYMFSANVLYYSGWGALLLGVGGGCFLVYRAKMIEDNQL